MARLPKLKLSRNVIILIIVLVVLLLGFLIYMFAKPKVLCKTSMDENDSAYFVDSDDLPPLVPNFSIVFDIVVNSMSLGSLPIVYKYSSLSESNPQNIEIYLINNTIGLTSSNNLPLDIAIFVNGEEFQRVGVTVNSGEKNEIGWVHNSDKNKSEIYLNGRVKNSKAKLPDGGLKQSQEPDFFFDDSIVIPKDYVSSTIDVKLSNGRFCQNAKVSYF